MKSTLDKHEQIKKIQDDIMAEINRIQCHVLACHKLKESLKNTPDFITKPSLIPIT